MTIDSIDYQFEYLKIASLMMTQFPTCEITTTDMVRLLIFENNSLRMTLKMPLRQEVVSKMEIEHD